MTGPTGPVSPPCAGCKFSSSGLTAGCVECCKRDPDGYARWSVRLLDELDELRAEVGQLRATTSRLAAVHKVLAEWRTVRQMMTVQHGVPALFDEVTVAAGPDRRKT